MVADPIVSVLMPVYNCEKYIEASVYSILNQTFSNFELLIIDDVSTDATFDILSKIKDDRILLLKKEKNSGYTDSLNYGLTIAKGKYIARMDGDDISAPERFSKQVEFLNSNPDVVLCGTGIKIIDSEVFLFHPFNHEEIKVKLCFSNAFFHPTIMARKEVMLANKYDKSFEPAEDYNLWTKLIFKGKMMNLQEALLQYRIHPNQISNYKNQIQKNATVLSQMQLFQRLFNDEKLSLDQFKVAFKPSGTSSINDFKTSFLLFEKIKKANTTSKIFDVPLFNEGLKKVRINFLRNYFKQNGFSVKHINTYLKFISFFDFFKMLNLKKRLLKLSSKQ